MKHAVITGASSEIGEALARELAHAGWRVTLVARRKDRLVTLATELEPPATAIAAGPRLYSLIRYFPAIVRWLLDRLTPRPLPRSSP